ncbi:MAG: Beta-galactosidase C-terminal domain [Bryobacterales bacterium]|nr:Beta-galactosidase C-terminal domain [Bryobacterales bacterium]
MPARWFAETLEVTRAQSKVVGRFENGEAAAVESSFGKGRALLVGSYVSAAYQTTPTAEGAAWFAGLLEWAGVAAVVRVKGEVEVRWLESGGDRVVFVFNHGAAAQKVELEWLDGRRWGGVTDVVSGGAVGMGFELEGMGVRVLRMRGSI